MRKEPRGQPRKAGAPAASRRPVWREARWVVVALVALVVVSVAAPFSAQWLSSQRGAAPLTEHTRDLGQQPSFSLDHLRGISYYEYQNDASSPQLLHDLRQDLPAIQQAGFNTVRLISLWQNFEPIALPTPQFNDAAFANLRAILQVLRNHQLHALLGVSYLGPGWTPQGIDYCQWFTNPTYYSAYEQFVQTYMRKLLDYASMTTILVFNEMAVPCGMSEFGNAQPIAALLQPTLGSLPSRLPPDLRKAFTIGFQENALISLGWGRGQTPLRSPISYDFLGMTFYNPDRADFDVVHDQYSKGCGLSIVLTCTLQKMHKRLARFRALYPATPVVISEAGATHCDTTLEHQAEVESAIVIAAHQSDLGLSLWNWRAGPPGDDCSADWAYNGLGIATNQGAPTTVTAALQKLLGVPQIAQAGATLVNHQTAVWIKPNSPLPAKTFQPRVYLDGHLLSSVDFSYSATTISFILSSAETASSCAAEPSCPLLVQVVDPATGLASDLVRVTVPGASPTPSPTPSAAAGASAQRTGG